MENWLRSECSLSYLHKDIHISNLITVLKLIQNYFSKKLNLMYFHFPGAMHTGNGSKVSQTGPQKEVIQHAASFILLARCVTSYV